MRIRKAERRDADAMFAMVRQAAAAEDALPFRHLPDALCEAHWFGAHEPWVAEDDTGRILGIYKLGDNYPDLGAHVASATYIVATDARRRGVGRALVLHSLEQARHRGYLAMQFNYVVSTNSAAVELYRRLGFTIAGTIPDGFRHGTLGLVDVYVMHRAL